VLRVLDVKRLFETSLPVTYKVEGRNPDGGDYEGTVEIAKQGKAYHLSF
jgi:hypothetical protein